jgi:glycosyltransferase involved in cell wall biosynthesis
MTARRLMFLLPFAPRLDATHGGARVAAQLMAGLAKRHHIALLYLRGAEEPPVDDAIRGACELVEEIARPWTGRSLLQQAARGGRLLVSLAARSQPLWVTDCHSHRFGYRVAAVSATWQPEVVHIEYHVMGQYLPALKGCGAARVLTEQEPALRATPFMLRGLPPVARAVHAVDRRAWTRFERDVITNVQTVIAFTEFDCSTLASLGLSTPLERIPFGTVMPPQPLDALGQASRPTLVFVGSFMHAPNVDAARRLIRGIFPSVQERYPDARLLVVGDQPPTELRRLSGRHVVVTGRVPSVRPYLADANVVVVPLRQGGGMRVKMVEALAAGKAIVASPVAVEGLSVVAGQHVALAESDAEFVDQIVMLLDQPERRAAMARQARAWACANLGLERWLEAYEHLYARLLDGRAR